MSTIIYLVLASGYVQDRERPVAAFADRLAAETYLKQIERYQETRPQCPTVGCAPGEAARWRETIEKWQEQHPGVWWAQSHSVHAVPIGGR